MVWDTSKKASKLWILLGLIGIGQLIALIYSLVSKNDKDRVLGVLFILGWLGDIIIYFLEKDKDQYMASMALYLLIGETISIFIVIALILFFPAIFGPSQQIGPTMSGVGFTPFIVTSVNCVSSHLSITLDSGVFLNGASSITLNNMSLHGITGLNATSAFSTSITPKTVLSNSKFVISFNDLKCNSRDFVTASGNLSYSPLIKGVTSTDYTTGFINALLS